MPEQPLVVVVDDNPGDVDLVRLALEDARLDVEVRAAGDGRAARDLLAALPDADRRRCRLILIDLNMPRMGGRDLLAWIRGQPALAELPIIVLTSSTTDEERTACLALGAREVWSKPQDFERLCQRMADVRRYVA